MHRRFAPWRGDFARAAALLAAAGAIVLAAAVWLVTRGGLWRWPPTAAAAAPAAALLAAALLGSAGLRRLRRGSVRRHGKRVERDAIDAMGPLPWGWRAWPNHPLPGGGDVDLLLRSAWGRRYAVEIKSKAAVSVERGLFGLRRHLRDARGRPLAHDPIGQTVRNARSLGARPVLWLPRATGPAERLTGGVLLVRGDARQLRRALGVGRWWRWCAGIAAALAGLTLAAVFVATLALPARAQEFRPYPQFRITEQQWQHYHDEVSRRHGASAQRLPAERLVVYEDRAAHVLWAFTEPGHPAHPAWVAKRVMRVGNAVGIQQVGYFAGDEVAFGQLFRSYDRAPGN